jgi:hypothetical protein
MVSCWLWSSTSKVEEDGVDFFCSNIKSRVFLHAVKAYHWHKFKRITNMKIQEASKREVKIRKFQLNQEASCLLAQFSMMPTKDVVELFNNTGEFIASDEEPLVRFNGKAWTVKSIEKLRKWISYGRERDIVKFIREVIADYPNRKPTSTFISKVLRDKYNVRRYYNDYSNMIKASDIYRYLHVEKDQDLHLLIFN